MKRAVISLVAAAGLASVAGLTSQAVAQPSLVPLSSFGNNGWRAPGVLLTGDAASATNGSTYTALGTSNNERGMAYNPATGNIIFVSRNSTNSTSSTRIRVLNGTTGVDQGSLSEGVSVIAGGTFVMSTVGVADDGAIYIANLTADARTSNFKVYRWANEGAQPTTHYAGGVGFTSTSGTPAPRLGDTLDVTGSGANTKIVAGFAGTGGYATITGNASPVAQTYSAGANTPGGPNFTPGAAVVTGGFRLGVTFAGNDTTVWGKQTAAALYRSTISGSSAAINGAVTTLTTGVSGGEAPLDYAVIGGVPYLATLDVNNSRVYIYDVSDPSNPVSLFQFGGTAIPAASQGSLTGNGNGTGSIKFGAIDQNNLSATIYTLTTNQGMQALTFTVPTPGAAGVLAMGGLVLARRRRA